jgi:hypothetical protein
LGKIRVYDQDQELQIIKASGSVDEYAKSTLSLNTQGDKLIILSSTEGEVVNDYFYNFATPAVNSLRELYDIIEGYIEVSTMPSAVQIKNLYESNPDTNAFTDADKTKLDATSRLIRVAGENIAIYQPVVIIGNELFLFDEQNPLHENKYIGISIDSAAAGFDVTVATGDEIDTTMTLTDGAIYYAIAPGALTTDKPSLGIVQIAGIATSTSKFFITSSQTGGGSSSDSVNSFLLMGG